MRRIALLAAAAAFVALGLASPAAQAATRDVAITGFSYKSGTCSNVQGLADLTINVNDAVKWTNCDSATHTVTSDTGAFDSDVAKPDGLAKTDFFFHQFSTTGDFPYHCRIHGSAMQGTIHVVRPAPTTTVVTQPPTTTTIKPTTTLAPTTTSTSTTQTTLDLTNEFADESTTSVPDTTTTTEKNDSGGGSSNALVVGLLVLAIAGVGVGAYAVWRRMQQAT